MPYGGESTDIINVEVSMELVVKSNKFDEIEEIIDNGGTLKSIKEII